MLAPFVVGSANMIEALGLSHALALTIMGVFVASFAATTLDTATRLQRYIIAELAGSSTADAHAHRVRKLVISRYGATTLAVVSGLALALSDAFTRGLPSAGLGGLTLWPVFGATNQLLGALTLLVLTVWLVKTGRPAWVTFVPMLFMLVITAWSIVLLAKGFATTHNWFLLVVSALMLLLQVWITAEGVLLLMRRTKTTHAPA